MTDCRRVSRGNVLDVAAPSSWGASMQLINNDGASGIPRYTSSHGRT